jgi:hypothetical protein
VTCGFGAASKPDIICPSKAACQRVEANLGKLVALAQNGTASTKVEPASSGASTGNLPTRASSDPLADLNDRIEELAFTSQIEQDGDVAHVTQTAKMTTRLEPGGMLVIDAHGNISGSWEQSEDMIADFIDEVARVPLGSVSISLDHKKIGETAIFAEEVDEILLDCPDGVSCIEIKEQNAASSKPIDGFKILCRARDCDAVVADLKALAPKADRARPSQAPPQSTTLSTGRALFGLLERINTEIARSYVFEPGGMTVTREVGLAADGRITLRGNKCAVSPSDDFSKITECRMKTVHGSETEVSFDPAQVDPSSIRLEMRATGRRVIFLCRDKSPCVMRPDRSRYFPGAYLACPNETDCNRLVTDFTSLLDLARK